MNHLPLAALIVVASTSASLANDWFPFDRHEALSRVRVAIEKMERIAPIPELECKPNPAAIRRCSGKLTDALTFSISETFRDTSDYDAFRKGDQGSVYEMTAILNTEGARPEDADMFDTLCIASVMTLRPKMSFAEASRRYSTALRRSVNRSRISDGETIVVGNPDTLITRASSFDLSCTISAEDDYWQK